MSFCDSAPSTTAIRWTLTVLVVGALAATVAVVAPLANLDGADARSPQSTRSEVVAVGTGTAPSTSVRAAALWTARPSMLVVPAGAVAFDRQPAQFVLAAPVAPVAHVAPVATTAPTPRVVVVGDFLSERDVRLEAVARATAKLRAEHEAAAAAAAAQAASAAAARAAAQVAAQATAQGAAAAAARAAAGFVLRVWTSGFQAEINQCRGAVDVSGVYQVRVIAEHSNCGGSRFPTAPGAIVTITGLDAGRYRVIGVVAHLNGEVNHAEDIPRGYDLLFQTCAGGFTDMRFTALQRIG